MIDPNRFLYCNIESQSYVSYPGKYYSINALAYRVERDIRTWHVINLNLKEVGDKTTVIRLIIHVAYVLYDGRN